MSSPWLDQQLFAMCLLGSGGCLLGLLTLTSRRRVTRTMAVAYTLAVSVCAAVSICAYLADQPLGIMLSPLGLACGILLSWVLRTELPLLLVRQMQRPQIQGAALLVLSLLSVGLGTYHVNQPEPFVPTPEPVTLTQSQPLIDIDDSPARTDKGHLIKLKLNPKGLAVDPASIAELQTQMVRQRQLMEQVIKLTLTAPMSNCHGWVFTQGNYWVPCEEVDQILVDNGYRATTEPQPGDIAVYRDLATDKVVHSGIIWTTRAGGPMLVQSKWGRMGIFMHPVDTHVYDDVKCVCYHSPRSGHRLVGLPFKPQHGDSFTAQTATSATQPKSVH